MACAFPQECNCCDMHTKCCVCRCKKTEGWKKTLLGFPKFTPESNVIDHWLSTGGGKVSLTRAWQFQREGFVHDVSTSVGDYGTFFVKSRCFRSLDKNKPPHTTHINIKKDDRSSSSGGRSRPIPKVIHGHCSCKAGSGGHCNHVFALLYQ